MNTNINFTQGLIYRVNNPRQIGFTLVELLVEISIIALLISLLLLALGSAKKAAKVTLCMSNLKQVCLAQLMYAEDFDGFDTRRYTLSVGLTWVGLLTQLKYIDQLNSEIFHCPSSSDATVAFPISGGTSYGIILTNFAGPTAAESYIPVNIQQLKNPSSYIEAADSGPANLWYIIAKVHATYPPPPAPGIRMWHGSIANAAFAYGHVEACTGSRLLTDLGWSYYDKDEVAFGP